MKCESCNAREATIHITKGSGLDKSEKFLCEQCANASFESDFSYPDESFNIHQLLKSLSQQQSMHQQQRKRKQCETCGSTIDTILKNGKFGCPDCYTTFDRQVPEIIARVQANQTEHIGKVPKKSRSQIKVKKQIETLKKKLSELIESQEFEEAAVIRDEIMDLEKAGGMDGTK